MDLRITNTCNNNCLYCLEQAYRKREKYIYKEEIFQKISSETDKNLLNFYGGNPLLHPDFWEIVSSAREMWYKNISVLTNSFWLNSAFLHTLIQRGLTQIGVYFNSFSHHEEVVNWGISLQELCDNLSLIQKSWIFFKIIIHLNALNLENIFHDIVVLHKKFWVKNFEFINYFPFDRPYELYKKQLQYQNIMTPERIKFFLVLKKLWLQTRFVKFPKEFFWNFQEFYDFQSGIIEQIWEEDRERLSVKDPFCLQEKRCPSCFIKDNCSHYAKI